MLFGPICGAAADRWSRKRCVVVADVLRAVAFGGVAVVGSFEATLALALLAGAGTALFRPSMLVRHPRTGRSRAAAGGHLRVRSGHRRRLHPRSRHWPRAFWPWPARRPCPRSTPLTFAISALVLGRLGFGAGAAPTTRRKARSLLDDTREGVRVVMRMRPIAILVGLMAGAMLSGGIFNVIELPFAEQELGAGDSGYSALVAVLGVGFLAGSACRRGGRRAALMKTTLRPGHLPYRSGRAVRRGVARAGHRPDGLRARRVRQRACS